jgi:hypothetical protein
MARFFAPRSIGFMVAFTSRSSWRIAASTSPTNDLMKRLVLPRLAGVLRCIIVI